MATNKNIYSKEFNEFNSISGLKKRENITMHAVIPNITRRTRERLLMPMNYYNIRLMGLFFAM